MQLFVRVVDASSFTAAAVRSNLTVAQVSRTIKELETRLETKLLHRNPRHVAMTDAGKRYLQQCRLILELVAQAEGDVRGTNLVPSGKLKMSSMASFGARHVLPMLKEYGELYPQVEIEYVTHQSMPDILARGIDVALYIAYKLPVSSLIARCVGSVRGHLCASPDYLDRRGTPRHPADLMDHSCINLVVSSVPRVWHLTDGVETVVLPVSGLFTGDSPASVFQFVEGGAGIGLLPPYSIVDAVRTGSLVHVLPQWTTPKIGVYLLLASRLYLPTQIRTWVDLLAETLPEKLRQEESMLCIDPDSAAPQNSPSTPADGGAM
jgi:DNA-binding transcriptional LysR family regulator